LGVSELREI
jgi:hypothetical protein